MGKIRGSAVLARNKRKVRRLHRRLDGRKGPGMYFFD
jgi:hypothetical protein